MDHRCPKCGADLPAGTPGKLHDLRVGELMTPDPVTIGPEESLMGAVEVMRRHKIRRLPVVVADRLVGLVAEGDLKRAQPSALSATQEEFDSLMEGTTVSRIMINDPVTATPDTLLLEAAETLLATKYGTLPVVSDGKLVGILTDIDLMRELVDVLRRAD
jgi:acetoin utilization protein AcuB